MKIYDVTNVIIEDDKLVAAILDGRENSLMIIKPTQDGDRLILETSEPDGYERYYWLDKLGLLPEEELTTFYKEVKTEKERKAIYETLKGEFDAPRAAMLDDREKAIQAKEQYLLEREGKLDARINANSEGLGKSIT